MTSRYAVATFVLTAALLCDSSVTGAQSITEPAAPATLRADMLLPSDSLPDAPGLVSQAFAPSPAGWDPAAPKPETPDGSVTLKGLPVRILRDELAVVTSPAHIRTGDMRWLLPLAGASIASLTTDSKTMRDVVSHNASFNDAALTSSDVLRGVFIGGPVALYGAGLLVKDEHAREAGLLAGEAMIDAYVADVAIKYITLRERPYLDNAGGSFFSGKAGSDPSFVSGHSVVAWSSAAVLAGEYSRPWQQMGIYTLATGVSLSRVMGQQHFPSDVLLGSAVGWLVGHYVYRAHHRNGHS